MKLTTQERAAMAAMMTLVAEKLAAMPETRKLNREQGAIVDRLCDVRNGLREVLKLA
jgi:hypothetical protein